MGNIINKMEFIKRKKDLIITSSIMSIIMFFVIGNWNMVNMITKASMVISKEIVVGSCFSLSYLNIFLLYLICAVTIGIMFKEKYQAFEEVVNNKSNKNKIFFTQIILCIIPIIVSIAINLFLKIVLYFILKGKLLDANGITFTTLGIFLIYILVITLLLFSILFLLNIAVKDCWIATLIPCFIINAIVLMFGLGSLLISSKLRFLEYISKPIEEFILGVLQLMYLRNGQIEYLGTELKIVGILFIVSILIIYICYVMFGLLNKQNIKKDYIFGLIRHVFYLTMSYILGYYLINGLGYIYLISTNKLTYDEGLYYINIGAFLVVLMFYILSNIIYKFKMKSRFNALEKEEVEQNEVMEEIIRPEEFRIDESIEESTIKGFLTPNEDNQDNENIIIEENNTNEAVEVISGIGEEVKEEILLENPVDCKEYELIEEQDDRTTLAERIYAEYISKKCDDNDNIKEYSLESLSEEKLSNESIEEIIIQKEIEIIKDSNPLTQE